MHEATRCDTCRKISAGACLARSVNALLPGRAEASPASALGALQPPGPATDWAACRLAVLYCWVYCWPSRAVRCRRDGTLKPTEPCRAVYRRAQNAAGYQHKYVIMCKHHVSYCCASCGENRPVHPARARLAARSTVASRSTVRI